jgi:hypothetical protein
LPRRRAPRSRRRVGIDAELRRLRRQPRAFVEGDAGADLVFLDHGEIGVRGGLWTADQSQDLRLPDLAERHDTPEPGDQAIAALGPRHDLDGHLLAARAQRGDERRHVIAVEGHAVADQVAGLDLRQRQALNEPPFLARLGQGPGHLREAGMFRRFARDLCDGWARMCL